MPIISKTIVSETGLDSNYIETSLNMARAVAASVGADYGEILDPDDAKHTIYYVPMDNIGYPGWFVSFETSYSSGSYKNRIRIYLSDETGSQPNLNDSFYIGAVASGTNYENNLKGCPETCVMIFDKNKDTVLFDVHMGKTIHGEDVEDGRRARTAFPFFFARDVNNDVLAGVGFGHITVIRTTDKKSSFYNDVGYALTQENDNTFDLLHLTKMVNYLSLGCPEMKSAYVSVVRPLEKIKGKLYVSELYANGLKWGRSGLIDSFNTVSSSSDATYPACASFFPIEPFVNY